MRKLAVTAACWAMGVVSFQVAAQTSVLNIYSARHYPGDDLLYSGFTKTTGIRINRVDADEQAFCTGSRPRAPHRLPM